MLHLKAQKATRQSPTASDAQPIPASTCRHELTHCTSLIQSPRQCRGGESLPAPSRAGNAQHGGGCRRQTTPPGPGQTARRDLRAGIPRLAIHVPICPWSTGSIRAPRILLVKSTLAWDSLCTSPNVTGSTPLGQSSPTTGCQGRQDIVSPVPLDVLFTRTPQSLSSLKAPNSPAGVIKCIVPGSQDREGLTRWQMSKSLARSKSCSHTEHRMQTMGRGPAYISLVPHACLLFAVT